MMLTKEQMDEIGDRSEAYYENGIRALVETEENIGKIVVIDARKGEYEVDASGLIASDRLRARCPNAEMYSLRIGYKAEETLGGIRERDSR